METSQKRAIWYACRERKKQKLNDFLKENNIDLEELGLSNIKYLEVIFRKLRQKGYII